MTVKVLIVRDTQKHHAGDIVEVPAADALDWLRAGIATPVSPRIKIMAKPPVEAKAVK